MFPLMASRILILNVLIANRKKRKTANGTDLLQLVHSSVFLTPSPLLSGKHGAENVLH
jgi:hypothetical protein